MHGEVIDRLDGIHQKLNGGSLNIDDEDEIFDKELLNRIYHHFSNGGSVETCERHINTTFSLMNRLDGEKDNIMFVCFENFLVGLMAEEPRSKRIFVAATVLNKFYRNGMIDSLVDHMWKNEPTTKIRCLGLFADRLCFELFQTIASHLIFKITTCKHEKHQVCEPKLLDNVEIIRTLHDGYLNCLKELFLSSVHSKRFVIQFLLHQKPKKHVKLAFFHFLHSIGFIHDIIYEFMDVWSMGSHVITLSYKEVLELNTNMFILVCYSGKDELSRLLMRFMEGVQVHMETNHLNTQILGMFIIKKVTDITNSPNKIEFNTFSQEILCHFNEIEDVISLFMGREVKGMDEENVADSGNLEDDIAIKHRKIKQPKYIREALDYIKTTNDKEKIEAGIKNVSKLICTSSVITIREVGLHLGKTLLFLQNEYEIEGFDGYRHDGILLLLVLLQEEVASWLVDEFYSRRLVIVQKIEILALFSRFSYLSHSSGSDSVVHSDSLVSLKILSKIQQHQYYETYAFILLSLVERAPLLLENKLHANVLEKLLYCVVSLFLFSKFSTRFHDIIFELLSLFLIILDRNKGWIVVTQFRNSLLENLLVVLNYVSDVDPERIGHGLHHKLKGIRSVLDSMHSQNENNPSFRKLLENIDFLLNKHRPLGCPNT